MIATLDLQFLLKTGLVVVRLRCKNVSLILRLLGQMIVSLVSLVLKNVSLMHPLLPLIALFHMMTVLFVLVLLTVTLDLLNLLDLRFRKSAWVVRMTALCDPAHLLIGMYDPAHHRRTVFFLVGLAILQFLGLPQWLVMIPVRSGHLHRRLLPVTIVQLERFHEIET